MIRDQGIRQTFAALQQEVDRLAAGLIALGLKPGDRVGLWSPNRIEWLLTRTDAVRHRQGGPDPSEHQSRLPCRGTGIRAEQG